MKSGQRAASLSQMFRLNEMKITRLRVVQSMLLESRDTLVNHVVLVSLVNLTLEFEDQHGLPAFLPLGEIFVEGRNLLAVLQAAILEVRVVVVPDADSVDVRIVVNQHDEVGGDVHIELAAPQSVLLCQLKRLDGVFGIAGFLAVPESPVRRHSDLLRCARSGQRYQCGHRSNFGNLFHIH